MFKLFSAKGYFFWSFFAATSSIIGKPRGKPICLSRGKHWGKKEKVRFEPDDEKTALKGPLEEKIFVFEKGVALRATTVGQKLE